MTHLKRVMSVCCKIQEIGKVCTLRLIYEGQLKIVKSCWSNLTCWWHWIKSHLKSQLYSSSEDHESLYKIVYWLTNRPANPKIREKLRCWDCLLSLSCYHQLNTLLLSVSHTQMETYTRQTYNTPPLCLFICMIISSCPKEQQQDIWCNTIAGSVPWGLLLLLIQLSIIALVQGTAHSLLRLAWGKLRTLYHGVFTCADNWIHSHPFHLLH